MFERDNFKKICFVFFFCLFVSPICTAQRPVEYSRNFGGMPISCSIYSTQASINGVSTGDTLQKVLSVFGNPNYTSRSDGRIELFYTGAQIQLIAWDPNANYTVATITMSGRGNFRTPDGVCVGMPETVLSTVYGTADNVSTERHKAPKLSAQDNEKYWEDLDQTIYEYNVNASVSMKFIVKKGVIDSIIIHASD